MLDDVGFAAPEGLSSDTSSSYELGIKSSFSEGRVTVNASLYYIDWEGMPVSISLPSCASAVRLNAGTSRSIGAEFEASANISDAFKLSFTTSYGVAELTEDAENLGSDGDNLPGSADFNASIGFEYGFLIADYDAYVRADYNYIDKYFHNIAEMGEASGGYSQINVKAGLSVNDVDIGIFVNNLTNADEFTWVESVWSDFGGSSAYRLRPRTVGLNVGYRF